LEQSLAGNFLYPGSGAAYIESTRDPSNLTLKGTTMNRTILLAAALSIAAIAAHAETPDPSGQFAHAVTSSKSRAQVAAELKEAQRTGDILAAGDQGATLYELNPGAYPARPVVAGKSREEVRDETLQAIQDGDIIVSGELGLTERQLHPQGYLAHNGFGRRVQSAKAAVAPVTSPQ
jgi:hypothetical protein